MRSVLQAQPQLSPARSQRRFIETLAIRRTALYRLMTDSNGEALGERKIRISRIGGWPNKRLYSRLNWLALSSHSRRKWRALPPRLGESSSKCNRVLREENRILRAQLGGRVRVRLPITPPQHAVVPHACRSPSRSRQPVREAALPRHHDKRSRADRRAATGGGQPGAPE